MEKIIFIFFNKEENNFRLTYPSIFFIVKATLINNGIDRNMIWDKNVYFIKSFVCDYTFETNNILEL